MIIWALLIIIFFLVCYIADRGLSTPDKKEVKHESSNNKLSFKYPNFVRFCEGISSPFLSKLELTCDDGKHLDFQGLFIIKGRDIGRVLITADTIFEDGLAVYFFLNKFEYSPEIQTLSIADYAPFKEATVKDYGLIFDKYILALFRTKEFQAYLLDNSIFTEKDIADLDVCTLCKSHFLSTELALYDFYDPRDKDKKVGLLCANCKKLSDSFGKSGFNIPTSPVRRQLKPLEGEDFEKTDVNKLLKDEYLLENEEIIRKAREKAFQRKKEREQRGETEIDLQLLYFPIGEDENERPSK
jgi:hypothetical protein